MKGRKSHSLKKDLRSCITDMSIVQCVSFYNYDEKKNTIKLL